MRRKNILVYRENIFKRKKLLLVPQVFVTVVLSSSNFNFRPRIVIFILLSMV
jgi:hypothetical protein